MRSENRFRATRGRPGPAVPNRTGRNTSSPGLRDCLAHFTTVMMPATSNEMEYSHDDFSKGRISECSRLPLMIVEEK